MSEPPPLVSAIAPEPASRSRRRAILLAGVCLVVLVATTTAIVAAMSGSATTARPVPRPAAPQGSSSSPPASNPTLVRDHQISRLLHRRSAAIVHHRRAEFAATLDPGSPRFRAAQLRMFGNLRKVPFASWSYTFDADGKKPPAKRRRRYDAPTYSPDDFVLHYRIAGFDRHPTNASQYPTFVQRHGQWYLGSLDDFASSGDRSSTELWDYAPVDTVRRRRVLALGPPAELATMTAAAAELRAAIPHVDAVWGKRWARRVVVLVPGTEPEMAKIDSFPGGLHQIVALTSAESGFTDGLSSPVGDRVTINPVNWSKLGSLGQRVVMTHELTHVATIAVTHEATPKWLSEGFADYIGFLNSGLPTTVVAQELAADVRAGQLARHLPRNKAFGGDSKRLSQAYESGWLACRYLAGTYSQAKLVAFYRVVGRADGSQSAAVKRSLRTVFRLTLAQFTKRWRHYVEAELG